MSHKRKILTMLLLSATPALAAVPPTTLEIGAAAVPMSPDLAPAPRPPPPDDAAPRALLVLRRELIQAGPDRGRTELPRFRPLCDVDGFPLVGNVASKGNLYQPSAFCADVRKAGA